MYPGIKVLFDNGHDEYEFGKCSPDAALGKTDSPYWYKEWMFTRKVARGCCDVMQAQGYNAELLVPEDTPVSLAERVYRVNRWCELLGKDNVLLISVHSNAAGGKDTAWKTARGWAIFTTTGITQSDYLAEEIHAVARAEFKPPLKVRSKDNKFLGRDIEKDFYIIRKSYCPAVLTENFFHDNKEDVLYLKSDKGYGSIVYVLTEGVINYIKKYKDVA